MTGAAGAAPGFEWVWADRSHLNAHIHDFIQDPDRVLEQIVHAVEMLKPDEDQLRTATATNDELWLQREFELGEPAGWTGLKDVCRDKVDSFWAYRIGRSVPSHLCLAEKELTRCVCLWGRWEPGRFVIHTLYPGRAAPREIHDPALEPAEIQASIDFWRCHAIVVREGEYTLRAGKSPDHD